MVLPLLLIGGICYAVSKSKRDGMIKEWKSMLVGVTVTAAMITVPSIIAGATMDIKGEPGVVIIKTDKPKRS